MTSADCPHCGEEIAKTDLWHAIPHIDPLTGTTLRRWHLECWIRSLIGGLNHLQGRCTCCGGTEPPDPPGMTRREAARAAVEYYDSRPD